MSNNTIR